MPNRAQPTLRSDRSQRRQTYRQYVLQKSGEIRTWFLGVLVF
jgi:hypothetical protein